ncbi:phosphatidylinositol 3-kinase [Mycena metata]|uniref:Serine/threonine-protein kinase TOR n=1 Tax=Mycena metata TaxID=1033252 RepID=A0AAD7K766_9AGAR|nr:phosphatidylinositol 3-kinase [Mycena metata]
MPMVRPGPHTRLSFPSALVLRRGLNVNISFLPPSGSNFNPIQSAPITSLSQLTTMASSTRASDLLAGIFVGLRSRNPDVRLQSALDLKRYANDTGDDADLISRRLFELIHSQNATDNIGGLIAIDHLIDAPDSHQNLFRFYNYVKHLLPNPDPALILAASKTLGHILALGGPAFGETFMEHQGVPYAIALISSSSSHDVAAGMSRYAGALILKELARNMPVEFTPHLHAVLETAVLPPLRDTRLVVREAGAELLAVCLELGAQRERVVESEATYLAKLLADAQAGMKSNHPEVIHGGLLTYRELLLHSGAFMRDSFPETADSILALRATRDAAVRRLVVSMIPTLASFNTPLFKELVLHKAMAHLLSLLEKSGERDYALIAIGHTATAVGPEMRPFLETVMAHITTRLKETATAAADPTPSNSNPPPPPDALLAALALLASAVGPTLTMFLHDHLHLLFAIGLSESLRACLSAIVSAIPPLLGVIQDRLLDFLSYILSGTPYTRLGAPSQLTRSGTGTNQGYGSGWAATAGSQDKELLTCALNTLGTFDFSGHILTEFAQTRALPYVEDEAPEVRRAAALACCRLFGGAPALSNSGMSRNVVYQTSGHSVEVLSEVLGKLLAVSIADPDPAIRNIVLGSLSEQFDRRLSQAENVRSLFIALNDEVFENRVTAATLIGRMARHNPAYVMPSLRKTLIQLLTEWEYSTDPLRREESIQLLTALVINTQRLIRPYALPMLGVLLQKVNTAAISASTLTCLGALASVGGEDAKPYIGQVMPALMAGLEDVSLKKRETALSALGRVCSSTGYVVTPLVEYPGLLPLLGRILRADGMGQATGRAGGEAMKREVVKVLGILGAMDPYRSKKIMEDEMGHDASMVGLNPIPLTSSAPITSMGTSPDEYFQTVVVSALLRVLKDSALSGYHHTVIEAIMSIFKTQGLKCVGSLPQIIPAFAAVTRISAPRLQEFHLQQLAILVGIIKHHVRNFAPEILGLVTELWGNSTLQTPIVALIEAVGTALAAELKPFLPTLLPLLLKVFSVDGELSDKRMATQIKTLDVFHTFGANIEEYLHLVIPIIVATAESTHGSVALRKKAILTVNSLSSVVNFSDHASRIVHPLMRILDHGVNELRVAVLDTMCSLAAQLGADFVVFVPTINKCLVRRPIAHPGYDRAVSQLFNGEGQVYEPNVSTPSDSIAVMEAAKLTVNQIQLKQAWDTAQVNTRQDWIDWIHRLGVELIKQSPSHALRACITLVETQSPLAKELFNTAFLSCWSELYEQYQDNLVQSLEIALTSPTTPSEVSCCLLDLCEFMEREAKPLPINHGTLGESSVRFLEYAKALHYKELEFFSTTSPAMLESLISINMRLQQHDAASGALLMAREQYDVTNTEEWYERLGHWQEALAVYDEKAEEKPHSVEIQIGRMRCLHALGEWDQLASEVNDRWSFATHEDQQLMAPMGAAAAWSLGEWDPMENYIAMMPSDSTDKSFYRAILSVHRNQFPKALSQISKARELLHPELTALGSLGHARSYNVMVRTQMLSELEEIVQYRQYADQPDRQQMMRNTWMKRLQGCQPNVEVWQRILQVRTLVINPEDDPVVFIKFANLCRKSDRMVLAEKTINSLLQPEKLRYRGYDKAQPNVVYAQLKYMWAQGAREESLAQLRQFTITLARDLQATEQAAGPRVAELSKLLARCYFKQGEWRVALDENWYRDDNGLTDVLASYAYATSFDVGWYKAWHTWAMANLNVINQIDTTAETRIRDVSGERLAAHVVQSIEGFFRSISLRTEDALQDTLRLLTLWFKYGAHDEISQAITSGLSMVNIDTWLQVIPQIIARIQTPHASIRRHINNLLTDLGKSHPQALIYPLTVGSKSPSESRRNASLAIMNRMRNQFPAIVEQARIVSRELIRVAILWHELWHEGLEEASRLYSTVGDLAGMFAVLEPLHDMLEAGPQTVRETSFNQVFGSELRHAREACRRYLQHGEARELDSAWGIYTAVYQRIDKQLPQLTALDLQYVSPELLNVRNLDLAVPGTYQSGREVIYIRNFTRRLNVITSKQRPRRMNLRGSDGRDYQYILKGHEDLRQDERVMQLFGLVNTLLSADTNSFKRQLHIQGFPVIPLAPNVGLFGAIHDTDSLHELVRDYRQSIKLLLNIEYRLMLQMAPDYENLPLLQKMEVFEYAMENTSGQDLYKILWLKSTNSEHWFERRATYTRSLAVNSMVGHILGLGDRHPSNIMLERKTGKVVHLDFGDCFEVAMHRDKFPEKIPFRLTRMLTHAMEVSGIEGSFRKTCEISMHVLRGNKESLMAVLEALVYDPLINWRLMQPDDAATTTSTTTSGSDSTPTTGRTLAVLTPTPAADATPRPLRANENDIFNEAGGNTGVQEVRNRQALIVYNRVQHKLTGRDFNVNIAYSVEQQVDMLIRQAMALENLCQCFAGWNAFW